jgi:predicted DNA-binding protein
VAITGAGDSETEGQRRKTGDKMVRRAYRITGETEAHIARLAKEMSITKEHVVQMALDAGLPEVEKFWERIGKPSGLDILRQRLLDGQSERISEPSAKRRSK